VSGEGSPGHVLHDANKDAQKNFGNGPVGGPIKQCPGRVPQLSLHVDADRDGKVDDGLEGLETWSRGKGKKGAVILCNTDDDDGNNWPDNQNDIVESKDETELAPLVLRRRPAGLVFPPGFRAFLKVSEKSRIRVFDKFAAGGKEILGPLTTDKFEIPDLSPEEITYAMEALTFPDGRFDGMVRITLEIQNPSGAVCGSQTVVVRVAPWLAAHHGYPTEVVYFVDMGQDNEVFRKELNGALTGSGIMREKIVKDRYAQDRWAQDVMELGFSSMPRKQKPSPGPSWHLPVVLRTGEDRFKRRGAGYGLDQYPRAELLAPDSGYYEALPPTKDASSLDAFGSLECSPPVKAFGREYPFGRIIHGHDAARPMHKEVLNFLYAQQVQSPLSIDTSWLHVGHVDEMISFCPLPTAADRWKRFKLVVASPRVALDILRDLVAKKQGNVPMFQGMKSLLGETLDTSVYTLTTPSAILGEPTFVAVQDAIQQKIDGIEQVLMAGLGLGAEDIIRLPVLFRKAGPRHVAYTPDVVNMLVVTQSDGTATLCVPRPLGPQVSKNKCAFEMAIDAAFLPTGNDVKYIDDFFSYHEALGEVHCGTNSKRKPPTDVWWWEWIDI
jgi:hypothetical protein